jgi:hypothetical protein
MPQPNPALHFPLHPFPCFTSLTLSSIATLPSPPSLALLIARRTEPALRVTNDWSAESLESLVFQSPPLNGNGNPTEFDIVNFELWTFE